MVNMIWINILKIWLVVNFDKLKDKRFFNFDYDDPDDRTILDELFIYKNIEGIPSVTEIYLEKNKLRNEDKVKMLNAMNNSYVSLFKIVGVDMDEAIRRFPLEFGR